MTLSPQDNSISSRSLLLGGIGFLALLTILFLMVQSIGIEQLQKTIQSAGIFAPLIFIGIKSLTFTIAPLSAGPIQFASGILFGVVEGTLYSVLGELIGGCLNFWIARIYGRRIVIRFVGASAMDKIDRFYEHHLDNWQSLAFSRLFLFSVYDFISYAIGFTPIKFRTYVIVSFVGGLIPTFIFVKFGSLVAQHQEILLLVYVVAALLFVGIVLLRKPIEAMLSKNKAGESVSFE